MERDRFLKTIKDADAVWDSIMKGRTGGMEHGMPDGVGREMLWESIFPVVCPLEKGREHFPLMPHTVLGDMAVFYYLSEDWMPEKEGKKPKIPVTAYFLEKSGVDTQELHEAAVKNIGDMERVIIKDVHDMYVEAVQEMFGPEVSREKIEAVFPEDEKKLYMVGLKSGEYGAAVILNDDVLQMAVQKAGEDFYILPTSVNEIAVISKKEDITLEELGETVREMNSGISPELVLSDSVYEYNAVTHELRLAAGEENIMKPSRYERETV